MSKNFVKDLLLLVLGMLLLAILYLMMPFVITEQLEPQAGRFLTCDETESSIYITALISGDFTVSGSDAICVIKFTDLLGTVNDTCISVAGLKAISDMRSCRITKEAIYDVDLKKFDMALKDRKS